MQNAVMDSKPIPFNKLKQAWMKDPSFRAECDRLKPEYELALALIKHAGQGWAGASGTGQGPLK